jgi:hypothetical protein
MAEGMHVFCEVAFRFCDGMLVHMSLIKVWREKPGSHCHMPINCLVCCWVGQQDKKRGKSNLGWPDVFGLAKIKVGVWLF